MEWLIFLLATWAMLFCFIGLAVLLLGLLGSLIVGLIVELELNLRGHARPSDGGGQ